MTAKIIDAYIHCQRQTRANAHESSVGSSNQPGKTFIEMVNITTKFQFPI